MHRLLLALALLPVTALALPAVAAQAVTMPTFGRQFCEKTTIRDYEAPLDRLPPVRRPPLERDLPFGPRNLSIYQAAMSRVIVGPRGGFGYGLFDETYGVREAVRLEWVVTTTLSRIDRRGRVLRTVDSEEQYLGVVEDTSDFSFWLDTPGGPALYRYDIEFRDRRSGDLLGAYAEYLRVVRATFHARIAVDDDRVRPGQEAFARVENRGSSWVQFGLPYSVQRFEEGRWIGQPLGVGAWPLPLLYMMGGQAGWCMRYEVPTDASPALYRFVKPLGFGGEGNKRATAAFRVLPS